MLSWIPDLASVLQTLVICLGALVFGLLVGHRVTPRLGVTALGILAFGMTATALWLSFAWQAPHVDPDQAVVEAYLSIVLLIPGFIIACFTCGVALATARRVGHSRWFVALVIASVLPLLATLAIWDYTIQALIRLSRLYPGSVVGSGQILAFLVAPIGTVALVVYGLYGQITPRRRPTPGTA
ncbi:MAG TPA: hypothetical protein VH393_12295 [Ktedonobacterales bacterium]|jgi:hypothetical protein